MERQQQPVPDARPQRLFVIDDEPSIRAAIKRFLTRRKWEVEEGRGWPSGAGDSSALGPERV